MRARGSGGVATWVGATASAYGQNVYTLRRVSGEQGAEDRLRVLIAGGGIAGLEAMMALRDLAGELVAVTLVAPQPEFT